MERIMATPPDSVRERATAMMRGTAKERCMATLMDTAKVEAAVRLQIRLVNVDKKRDVRQRLAV